MTADKKNNIKNQQQQQNKFYKAARNCAQPKNISRFRPYKKEKTTKKKICEIKAAHIKNKICVAD